MKKLTLKDDQYDSKISVELSSDATIDEMIIAFRTLLIGQTYDAERVDVMLGLAEVDPEDYRALLDENNVYTEYFSDLVDTVVEYNELPFYKRMFRKIKI